MLMPRCDPAPLVVILLNSCKQKRMFVSFPTELIFFSFLLFTVCLKNFSVLNFALLDELRLNSLRLHLPGDVETRL